MLIKEIPYHLRHTITHIEAPVFLEPVEDGWRSGVELDLQFALWLLGCLENQGRPGCVYAAGEYGELLAAHRMVKRVAPPSAAPGTISAGVVRPRPTHSFLLSNLYYKKKLPVLPLEQVKASPAEANLGYHGLPLQKDRPAFPRALIKPNLADEVLIPGKSCSVLFPWGFHGGVERWWDPVWWNTLALRLKKNGPVIVLGPPELRGAIGQADRFQALEPPGFGLSYLGELAGLLAGAGILAGRRGSLGCLASALGERVLLVWDSLLAYRYWASPDAGHVVLANPYALRYPQALRQDEGRLWSEYLDVEGKDPASAGTSSPKAGPERERFDGFRRNRRQAELAMEELRNLQDWLGKKELRELFYAQSLDYAAERLLRGGPAAGAWITPVAP